MGMVVRTNMAALNANNSLQNASKAQQKGMEKLASGFKINKAADDASGLAISEKMKNQIKALDTAKDNCEDGANLIQTAEGYMAETHDMLNRMVELSEKAANGTLGDEDRKSLQDEMDQLCGEIDRIATTANFNGHKLLDGSIGSKAQVKLDSNFKYVAPADANKASKLNNVGGGVITNSTGNENFNVKSSYNYQVTGNFADGNDNGKSCTIDAQEVLSDGTTLSGTDVTFTIEAKKGDTVTIDGNGDGVTSNGLKLAGGTDVLGATLTFDGNDWVADNGAKSSSLTISGLANGLDSATGAAGNFTFEDASTASGNAGINLQIGESSTSADRLTVSVNSFHTDALFGGLQGVNKSNDSDNTPATAQVKVVNQNNSSTYTNAYTIKIDDQDNASAAADALRQISSYVSDERGKLGAQQNRLDHTVNNLTTASENTSAANSRIRDTDMAKEMMAYTSKNVIAQAAQSMLAQANSQPQNVLSLLQ